MITQCSKTPLIERIKLWALVGLSLCLIAGCSAPPTLEPPQHSGSASPVAHLEAFTSQLDQHVPQWLQRYRVPGAAVAIVRNGKVVWSAGYGLADKDKGRPVTPNTVFQVASFSKSVTAWGALRLVESGQLDLDAPVEQYLTRWHLPPSEYDADGVTVRRLLSHTAGLAVPSYLGWPPAHPLPSLEESLSGDNNEAGELLITMEPGAQYSYSGGGYTLLQLIIEEVTGETFSVFMQREILNPLGMTDSSFEWRLDMRPATAIGHDISGKPYPNYRFTEQAAAGLYTTAPDLARFLAAEMTGPGGEPAGRGVLASETITLMHTPVITLNETVAMGLGHFTETLPDGSTAIMHSGGNLGWTSRYLIIPERGEGIVILTNSSDGYKLYTDVSKAWKHWLGADTPSDSQ